MAATGPISSEFDRLQDANWLSTAYTLGLCAAQPMYGKLSDIYGRKPLLLASYFFLAFGCVICGVASLMSVMILGRVISGIGGAGVMAMSSIIITDIVPKREVATWRAYVNISMTLGRSIGGPLGGWLTDTIGWRWLFLLQAPMMAIAALLVIFLLQLTRPRITPLSGDNSSSIRRVDFLGTALLATSIVGITLLFDRGGQAFPWISLSALALASIALVTLATFVYVETYVALEPIFDLRILRRPNVVSSYLIGSLQICAQIGMMFTVPLYFQVTESASATVAGAHLIPAVIGNTIGGLMAGAFIRRTGQYKPVVVMAGFVASIAYVLLYLRWNGHTGFWESLYIFPGGMGTAFASAAAFVTMTSFLEPEEVAMATGGYILLFSFALTAGVTAANTVLGLEFKRQMELKLSGPGAQKIIQRAMSDTQYIAGLKGHVRQIVVGSYIAGLKHTYIISFACSILASIIGLAVRNHRL
ncbi:hypothetical protein ASPZODRAFT_136092 [Penicilliopsis zonata CBS 506.65]|uniref:Major facilitator superfamily (MFS) profile domain-containing protein n=1 Tax=Penicilliopsis zonata CBS 506.65 TaxID=1073090 RepID=A0A1L9S907_9EURO|nr:hypothetical protein ASPZODRAFT_136092 [Penicilliopsis zonata CBS 506.65]OJJ43640.1 hypothetical protein ASPZODRAFT_136092 [Penicilliopsis zonata CBS 506.65]